MTQRNTFERIQWLIISLLACLVLVGCGGGGGGSGSTSNSFASIQNTSSSSSAQNTSSSTPIDQGDGVFTGGDGNSFDDNLIIATFSDTTTSELANSGAKPALKRAEKGGSITALQTSALSQSRNEVRWMSQYTAQCVGDNGYCGFASILMGADYLLNGNTTPTAPLSVGYGGDTAQWIYDSVKSAVDRGKFHTLYLDDPARTPIDPASYLNCGGPVGIYYDHIPDLAEALGLAGAKKFDGTTSDAENWIKTALSNNQPVVALVPYQGSSCSGRNGKTMADFYGAGSVTQEVMPCDKLKWRHWVLVAGIDLNSVLIYDPDPEATSDKAGIRRYTKESFFGALPDTRPNQSGRPNMYRLCASEEGCKYEQDAFSTLANIELGAGVTYAATNSNPIAAPFVDNYSFESPSGLPSGLAMDTEGRITGTTTETGTFYPTITMRNVVGGIERVATKVITLTVNAAGNIKDKIWFALKSVLKPTRVDAYYNEPLATNPTLEPMTFSVVNNQLPSGLKLQDGSIVGVPTQAGTYNFTIEASTSTTSTTQSFTLTVDPAADNPPEALQPYLEKVAPSPVHSIDGQQYIKLIGTDFSDVSHIRLEDITHNETFDNKVPLNPTDTEITIRANFTSKSALWSATVVGSTGLESNTVQFNVVAPTTGAEVRPAIWPSAWTPPRDGTLEVTGNYGAFSKGCPNADLISGEYAWYLKTGRTEHLGMDLRATVGTSVRAIAPGKVLAKGKLWGESWGDVVLIEHWTSRGETFTGVYGHINASVSANQKVDAGVVIGTVYNLPDGPHLHFGVANGSRTTVPGLSSFNDASSGNCISSSDGTVNPENFLHNRFPSELSSSTTAIPATPTNPQPGGASGSGSTASSSTMTLSWSASIGATYYEIGVKDIAASDLVVNTTSKSTSHIANLTAGKQYRWNVAACNSAGCSKYTAQLYFQTPALAAIPSPTISSINPTSMTAGSGDQTLIINGSNFTSGNYVQWRSNASSTWAATNNSPAIASGTKLTVLINPGTVNDMLFFQVCNSAGSCSASSNGLTVTSMSVIAPTISSVSPNPMTGSASNQTLTLTGSNFRAGATVELKDLTNGGTYTKTPTSLSTSQISISANFTTAAATWSARVINTDGTSSSAATFKVSSAAAVAPSVSSVSPNPVTGSASNQTLTLTGSNFRTGATVELKDLTNGGTYTKTPTSLSASQISISANFTTAAATWSARVINADGTSSSATTFKVSSPAK